MIKHLSLLCFLLLTWLVIANASAPLEIGKVFNWTFTDESTQTMEFELSIPYNPDTPDPLRTVILTYVPFDELTVYASLSNPSPNSTTNDYVGTDKDGSFERGIVWIDNLPLSDVTLYISVSKITPDASVSDFGLNAEVPVSFSSFVVDQRNEVITEVLPWQTKWFLIEIPDEGEQYMSAFRAEFCDEAVGSVSMSLVFPETNTSDVEATLSVCGCDDTYVEDRSNNLISTFALKPTQMFILPEPAIDDPVYIGIFYGGPDDSDFTTSYSRRLSCAQRQAAARKRSATSSLAIDAPAFSVRLSMWGQELYPAIRTKYLKPDMVDKDLIANVDDTPFCDFWADDSFSAYVSKTEYASFDSSCFLETHSDLFTTYSAETLFGAGTYDRSLILRDFYKDHDVTEGTAYINFVHTHNLCGSYAYYHAEAPEEGWVHKKEWAPAAIGIVVILGFLFVVFFISTIILVLRLREYTRYRRIKD